MRRIIIALAACSTLAGCATKSPGCATPELVEYDDDTMAAVAQELESASERCAWCELIVDYGRLRAQVRAIRGGGK